MQTRQDVEKRVNLKIKCLKVNFEKNYLTWKTNTVADDRVLFCRIYEILIEATEAMREVDNSYIWLCFNREFEKYYKKLERIKRYFISRQI